MKRITVRLEDLATTVEQMKQDKIEYVEMQIVSSSVEGDDLQPSFVHFDGVDGEKNYTDYESIDSVRHTCNFV